MKIDQNVTYLKNVPGTAPSVTARNSASSVASAVPAVASQAQALLPSTNGDFDAGRVAQPTLNLIGQHGRRDDVPT